MLLVILAGVLFLLIYFKVVKPLKYWETKGVPYLKPWPVVGNSGPFVFGKRAFTLLVDDFYKAYPDKRYAGIHQFTDPVLLIRDPDLLKKISVKDFDAFPDRQPFGTKDSDPLWSQNLVQLAYKDGWHSLRATISPAFTSSKMKAMFVLMKEISGQLIKYLEDQGDMITLELKDTFSKFTNDVIASTAFGVTCNSLDNPKNEFFVMGKEITTFSGLKTLKFFGHNISPRLMKLLGVTIFDKKVSDFFRNLVKETIRIREEKQIIRPDMIHLLMEARKGRLKFEDQSSVVDSGFAVVEESHTAKTLKKQKIELTDEDITAQVLLFFQAGFDSASTVMSYACYALALDPDIQEKLREEVDATLESYKGEITYEALLGMKYLDAVVSETLRRYPPGAFTNRISAKPYVIEPELPGEKAVHLDAGTILWLPFYAIHMDSKYYPNPEKFDPERFTDENKQKIKPSTYFPFGAGPRNCIGSRFALLEVKLMLVEVIRKFEIVPVEKTQIPIVLSVKNFNPVPDDGIWVGMRPRTT